MAGSSFPYCRSALGVSALVVCAALAARAGSEHRLKDAGLPIAQQKAKAWGEQSLELRVGYRVYQPTRAELGFRLEAADAHAAVSGSHTVLGLFGTGQELEWRSRLLDPLALASFLDRLRAQVERLPVAGSFAPDGTVIEGLPGEAFDVIAAHRAIERALMRGESKLVIETLVSAPPPNRAPSAMTTDVLMREQETHYVAGTGRATNIELAAKLLDGHVLQPGAAFSFNEVVGRREQRRGFAAATELVGGELVQGVGGGVCQVAGTLHATAFFAGLVIDEYHAHSRLSRLAYLPPGLDAMVAWPADVNALRDTQDMRLRNPYPFPVRISARARSAAGVLTIALYGAAPPFHVDFELAELARVPAGELQRVDPSLRPGETRVQQKAFAGLVIVRRRTIYTPKGRFSEQTRIAYPPTPRIVLVSGRAPR